MRRSPIKRRPIEPRKCEMCPTVFRPRNSTHSCCSIACATEKGRQREEKKARLAAKRAEQERRAGIRAAKEKLKSPADLEREAQDAFNRFIRLRDERAGLPCISCGEFPSPNAFGGTWDAGHYRTRGAAPELRFEELNCHRQCKSCNSGVKRQGSRVVRAHDPERAMTIRAQYRVNLIARIGIARVEWLEGPHEPKRYRADDYRAIKATYLAKCRELSKSALQI